MWPTRPRCECGRRIGARVLLSSQDWLCAYHALLWRASLAPHEHVAVRSLLARGYHQFHATDLDRLVAGQVVARSVVFDLVDPGPEPVDCTCDHGCAWRGSVASMHLTDGRLVCGRCAQHPQPRPITTQRCGTRWCERPLRGVIDAGGALGEWGGCALHCVQTIAQDRESHRTSADLGRIGHGRRLARPLVQRRRLRPRRAAGVPARTAATGRASSRRCG